MGDTALLDVVRFGPSATEALVRMVGEVQAEDPLAPVDVVVPSDLSGVTLRRTIARPALANVRFGSLPRLAERLARRRMALTGARPLTATARGLAVRRAVQSPSGELAAAATHPATAAMLEELFTELDDAACSETDLTRMAETGGRAGEVADLYRRYRESCDGLLTDADMLRLAASAVREGEAPQTTVILHAPHRLSPPERELLTALAGAGRLRCVLALTGDDAVDVEDHALLGWLEGLLGPAENPRADRPDATDGQSRSQERHVSLEPDAEEEVRAAVRLILAYLDEHPVRPERIAVAYRSAVPYARMLEEQLGVAGLPFHVAGGRRLADSVPGRTLLRLLDLHTHGYPRSELLAWLSAGPVLTAGGSPVPLARWERLSRNAGVSHGHQTWRARLDRHAADLARRRDELDGSATDAATQRSGFDRRIRDCRELGGFVDDVVGHCEAVADACTWAEVGERLEAALTRFLGGPAVADTWAVELQDQRWHQVERTAYDAVLAALGGLAELDDVGAPPSYDEVRQVLARALDLPMRSGTTLGRGIAVTRTADLVGADLDLLVVLGMSEDAFPPRIREHPILGDAARSGAGLLDSAARRALERRALLAAAASARCLVLSAPKADTRAQRALHPSPWFMEAVAGLNEGVPVPSEQLATSDELATKPWFTRHDSFLQALSRSTTPANSTELDVQLALDDALDLDDARYRRARSALRARIHGEFGAWTGHVGDLDTPVRERVDRRLSASSLQTYATCPRHFWLDRALGVHDLEDPGEDDMIDVSTRGTLVHRVLERFVAESIPPAGSPEPVRSPDEAWTDAEIDRALALLEEESADLEAQGLTGRPLLWQAEKQRLRRQVRRVLRLDSQDRATRRSAPVAVEALFGRGGEPPLVVDLPGGGQVELGGSIDRVDRTADGSLVVTDYKTGSDSRYQRIPTDAQSTTDVDMVDRGRLLQLVLYGLAARERFGTATTPVTAYYWFLGAGGARRGGPVDVTAQRRLEGVLDVIVDGARSGVFPARPGDDHWEGGWDNCRYCPFERVCPTSRPEEWERVRAATPVQRYAAMADPPPADSTDDHEEAGA